MLELFVRRLCRPPFTRRFHGFVVAIWLGLSLASVAGCTTRVDNVVMPVAPAAPISLSEIADVSFAPPVQKDEQPQPTKDAQAIVGVNRKIQFAIQDATGAVGPDSTYLPAAARANPDLFKPHGHIASAKAIVRKIAAHYQRQELRFVQQTNTTGGRAPTDKYFPNTLRGWPSGDVGPISNPGSSLAFAAP